MSSDVDKTNNNSIYDDSLFSEQDHHYMKRAIELAKRGRFTTTPNPNVGCVIVKNEQIIGEGFHQQAGTPHAEVHALAQVKDKTKAKGEAQAQGEVQNQAQEVSAQGATVYVTLEPCSHYGRTPPCSQALIDAGVSKVVVAMQDPNPQVAGQGLAMLTAAGIEVHCGLLEAQARELNQGFLKRMETGRPFVTCKLAASLDGKTALANGQSQWITSQPARQDVQWFRAQSCAILTGADTVLTDDARLNVRASELPQPLPTELPLRQPIRVVIDSQNRLHPDLALFSITTPVVIFSTSTDNTHSWPEFVSHKVVAEKNGKVDLTQVLQVLAQMQINHIWLEAGATLAGAMAQCGLIDEYIIYIAPKLMGHDSKSLIHLPMLQSMADVYPLKFTQMTMVGDDIRIHAKQIN